MPTQSPATSSALSPRHTHTHTRTRTHAHAHTHTHTHTHVRAVLPTLVCPEWSRGTGWCVCVCRARNQQLRPICPWPSPPRYSPCCVVILHVTLTGHQSSLQYPECIHASHRGTRWESNPSPCQFHCGSLLLTPSPRPLIPSPLSFLQAIVLD